MPRLLAHAVSQVTEPLERPVHRGGRDRPPRRPLEYL